MRAAFVSRTVSSSATTNLAITGTRVAADDAMMINARRYRTLAAILSPAGIAGAALASLESLGHAPPIFQA